MYLISIYFDAQTSARAPIPTMMTLIGSAAAAFCVCESLLMVICPSGG